MNTICKIKYKQRKIKYHQWEGGGVATLPLHTDIKMFEYIPHLKMY